jgi:hypothetical protein
MRRTVFLMPRKPRAVRYAGPCPTSRQGEAPWTPGPLSLPLYVPERSSPSRVRFAAHKPRALDCSGPFRRFTNDKGKRANANPSQSAALCGLPLVGPELHEKFGVDKTS